MTTSTKEDGIDPDVRGLNAGWLCLCPSKVRWHGLLGMCSS